MYKCPNCGQEFSTISGDVDRNIIIKKLCNVCRVELEKSARRTCEEDS